MKFSSLSLLGVTASILLILSGCGGSKSADKDSENKSNNFTVLNVRFPESKKTYLTEGAIPATEKEAGVKIKFKTVTSLEWPDKKGVLLGGGDLPDAFIGNTALNDADIANNEDALIPLEKYIDKDTMPNLTKIMKKDPKMRAIVTNADGHIYSLPSRMSGRPKVGNQLFINKVWMDKLGLKMPTTYQEFEDVVLKMVNGDPNGNGKKDEIGLEGYTDSVILPFGIVNSSNSTNTWMNYDGKKISYLPTTQRYKKAIEEMHSFFVKGGIDPELFTQDFTTLMAKQAKVSKVAATVN